MKEITDKIVSFSVGKDAETAPKPEAPTLRERPDTLSGSTYKIKGGSLQHSYYVTINDNPEGVPMEIFISSQDTEHYQWVSSLTRMVSAVFRRSEDVSFVAEELKAIVDPAGGLGFMKLAGMNKPRFIASIPAAIGFILEHHISAPEKVEEKATEEVSGTYPESAVHCKKCGEKAVVMKDGCATCLSCGESKCG